MNFIPGDGIHTLDRYEARDGALLLGLANEAGDITAYVERPDGSRGHSYGGPVYEPHPTFQNVCERCELDAAPSAHRPYCIPECCTARASYMTAAERDTANVMARKVGWMS